MSSSPSTIPSSPTENGNTKDIHQEKLKQVCIARGWPEPKYCLVSDRRGGRTAWSCTVHVGSQVQGAYQVSARYWYNGHHNAYEDAAEVCFNNIVKAQAAPLSPTPAYHNCDDNNAYAHWGINRSPTSPISSPPINPIGLNRSGTFSPGDYPSSNYTTSPPPGGSGGHGGYGGMGGVGMCPGSRNTHSHSQAHASAARGKSYVSSSFGG
ncbi:hypothetical protein FPQ18DRAFT_383395 [Pyronema domesticum]|uniref:Uncharacterized protein n=1 Tax=Pyronema omphalodes (strain CBS 100304) TaxID=1076935 RepID=U4KWC2_PYROM|nr:hypothetical protein FPQ18DRAFT_383395 [Pyronema domesticum]CCX06137.1 Similar to predicted protein [Coccidioides immitis RS]; acc. no. XP_001241479 [Pyronema omphalodes CBS 100304]